MRAPFFTYILCVIFNGISIFPKPSHAADELINGKSNLYLIENEPFKHRFSVYLDDGGGLRIYVGAETLEELRLIPLKYSETLWGALTIGGGQVSEVSKMPKALVQWQKTLEKKVRREFPKARNIQIRYEGQSRKITFTEIIPNPIFPVSRPDLAFFGRGTFYLHLDGTVKLGKYMEGLTDPHFELAEQKMRFPSAQHVVIDRTTSVLRDLEKFVTSEPGSSTDPSSGSSPFRHILGVHCNGLLQDSTALIHPQNPHH